MNNKWFSSKCDETLYLQKMYKIDIYFFFFRFWAFFFSRDLLLPQIPLSLSNQTVDMRKRLRNQNETLINKQYDDWKRTFKEIKQWENKSGGISQNPCLTLESSDWRPRITIRKSKTKQIGYLNTKKQNKRKVCLSAATHHVIFPSVLTHGLVKAETHGTNIWIETEIQKDTNVLPSFGCEPCEKTQERRQRLGFRAGKMGGDGEIKDCWSARPTSSSKSSGSSSFSSFVCFLV